MKKSKFLRSFLIIACFLIISSLNIYAISADLTGGLGDANGNGEVDIVDALITAQFYVGLNPQPFDQSKADYNQDGAVNIIDALLIAQLYVGLIQPPSVTPAPTVEPTAPPTTGLVSPYYVVATNGSDSNPGTLAQPFATLQKAANTATAGYTVYIRAGTYSITTPNSSSAGINFSKSGTSDSNRIKYWAYPGEIPVFDFSRMTISGSDYTHGFVVTGSWLHFKGIEEKGVPMNSSSNCGMHVDNCSNNTFELMNFHHNSGTGIFFSHGTGGHLILNCDSHDNYDAKSSDGAGENADGFGVHYQESGPSTIIRGCRAWWNSDDGYDFISQEVPVTIEDSYAYGSGYINSGSGTAGNGNGFKIGSSKNGIRHIVQNNVAWGCRASGFYANHSSCGNTWYNNTAYNNGTAYNLLASTWSGAGGTGTRTDGVTLTGSKVHIMRNNIGYPNKNSYMNGVDTKNNTWDLNITPASKDFLSVTAPSVGSGLLGPRQANGNPPDVDFLKLASGSAMIDKGTNVGLPFNGAAPDLGAYEY